MDVDSQAESSKVGEETERKATAATMTKTMTAAEAERRRLVPKLKLWARERVRKEWIELAFAGCDPETLAFVECSKRNGLGVVFWCRKERDVMNACLKQYTTDKLHNALKRRLAESRPDSLLGWQHEDEVPSSR
mmetsp:Transcript_3489/g.9565  ORF Transcript_3489/g.9565 Transcript_3489/m.9565 type:complete len:134 (-) Transcript_3489:1314-1715(-)